MPVRSSRVIRDQAHALASGRARRVPGLHLAALAALVGGLAGGARAAGDPEAAQQLLRHVEERHARLQTLSADFTQTFRSAAIGHEVVETGRIFVKRPGRMRWDYRRPDKKVFLIQADGTTLAYVPADRSAVRSRIPADAPHLRLLLGESDLSGDFQVEEVTLKSPRVPGTRHLRLTPRGTLGEIDLVYLEVDPDTYRVARVLIVDREGNESDLVLARVREDVPLRDSAFEVRLPRSIHVRDLTRAVTDEGS